MNCSQLNKKIINLKAKQGLISINHSDLNTEKIIPLEGEWEIQSGIKNLGNKGFLEIPNFWDKSEIPELKNKQYGSATFRLILTGLDYGEYAIKFREIQNAYKVYINGELKLSFGEPSEIRENEIRKIGKPIIKFIIPNSNFQTIIVIQVSNWFDAAGGIRHSPEFGKYEDILNADRARRNFDFITFGALFFFGFSSLFFYLISREEKSPLFLSLVCSILALRIFFTEEHYVFEYFPNINPILEFRIDMGSLFVLVGVFIYYIDSLFPKQINQKLMKIVNAPSIFMLLIFSFLETNILIHLFKFYLVFILYLLFLITFVSIKSIKSKIVGAKVFFSSWCLFAFGSFHDILHNLGILPTPYISSYTFLIFISFQSVLISIRYKHMMNLTDSLNEELEVKFRAISTTIQEAIIVLDNAGNILFGNEGAYKILGWEKDKLKDYQIDNILSLEEMKQFENGFFYFIKNEEWKLTTISFEFIGRQISGKEFPLEVSFTNWVVSDQKYFGLIIRDITNRRLLQSERDLALKTMKEDLEIAEKLQKGMIPTPENSKFPFNWYVIFNSLSKIGGDIYDIKILKNGNYRFFLADATGHGTQGALLAMAIKADYDTIDEEDSGPSEILEKLNSKIYPLFNTLNSFFTGIIFEWNPNTRELKYASGGHPEQILITHQDIYKLSKTGPMLCLYKNANYITETLLIKNKFRLFIFTDGAFEVFDQNENEIYDDIRLHNYLYNSIDIPLPILLNQHKKNLIEFHGKQELDDDLTMIGIEL